MRQVRPQIGTQLLHQCVVIDMVVADHIGHEMFGLTGLRVVQGRHHGDTNGRMLCDRRLHRTRDDAVAPQLHHKCHPALNFKVAIGQNAPHITGAKQPRCILSEGVLDKPFCGSLRFVEIAARHRISAHIDFAPEPQRHGL